MNIRRLVLLLLTSALLVPACSAPMPQIQTPAQTVASPTPLIGVSPALPTATTLVLPTRVPVTDTPAPTGGSNAEDWPVILNEIQLGFSYNPEVYPKPLVIDPAYGRVYISGVPTRTIMLSTQDLIEDGTLDIGGNLALDTASNRLFIGTPNGLVLYSTRSSSKLTQLALASPVSNTRELPLSISSSAIPLVSESNGDVYAIQQKGLYRVSSAGLFATSVLSQPRDIRAITLDEQQNLLYAVVNNGIPGSNNENDLLAFDTRTWQIHSVIYNVRDLALDKTNNRLFVALSGGGTSQGALQIWSGAPLTYTKSLSNISGQLAIDAERDRLYIMDGGRLMALQASTLAVVADLALPASYATMALDARADRLYLLSQDGDLLVMNGHGGQAPRALPTQPAQPPAVPITQLIVSPDVAHDKTIFGVWGSAFPQGGALLVSQDGGATWSNAGNGLPGFSSVTDLIFSPDFARDRTLFAATLRGVYRSTDGGQTWLPASVGLGDLWITQLAISPAFSREPVLYASAFSGGLYRTMDGGQTWTLLANQSIGPTEGQRFYTLALSPDFEQDRTVFLSAPQSSEERLLVSHDAGDSWTRLASATASALYLSPGFAQDHTLFGMFEGQGLMRSTDGGQTWRGALRGIRDASSQDRLALSTNFQQDRTAWLLTRNSNHLYRTTDDGETWQISTSTLASTASTLAVSGKTVWLGSADGKVLTANIGDLAWATIAATLSGQLEAIALSPAFDQDSTLFVAGKNAGVWMSTVSGRTWLDTGFPARELGIGRMHLAISPAFSQDRVLFAATGSQLYRSTDAGKSWQVLPIGQGNLFPINALAISPNYADDHTVMLAGDYRNPTVLRSTDGGDTWQSDATGLPKTGNLNQLTFSPNFAADRGVYVWAESDGLYRSGDGGQTWARVYQPAGSWLIQSFALSPDFQRDRLMFLGTLKENHNVYRSADGGASWHPSELGLPLELLWASALALSPDFSHDRTIFLGTDRGIYRSSDGGQMWRLSVNLPEIVALTISSGLDSRYTIFTISARDGLFISANGGETWQPVR